MYPYLNNITDLSLLTGPTLVSKNCFDYVPPDQKYYSGEWPDSSENKTIHLSRKYWGVIPYTRDIWGLQLKIILLTYLLLVTM